MLHPEVDSLVPHVPFTRRAFVQAALGGGFAAAALPISAQTIHTDDVGLDTGEVAVRSGGDWVPVYCARPKEQDRLPVMIVVHEIFGVHEHITDVCRRFAKLGYLALAPDLYAREGNAAAYSTILQLNEKLVSKVPDTQVLADLDATVAWIGQHGGDPARIGLSGFCWGGRIAWLYAEHNPQLRAVAAWYGRPAGATSVLNPVNPIDRVGELRVPVLAMYGGQDPSIPAATVAQMQAAVKAGPVAGRGSEFVIYPDAPHAFFADYRPSYRKADAADSWRRALAWFRAHGVVERPTVGERSGDTARMKP